MCQDVSRNYRWKVARIKGVHFPIWIFREKNLEIRLVSQKFLLHLIMMPTNSSYIYVSDVFSWSLQSNKKRRMTFLKLKVPVQNLIKRWGQQLCSRMTRPSKVQLMFSKTNFCPREALLAKLTEPPETKPDVGIGTETTERAWNGYGKFAV
jgi:hypothetical protein